MARLLVVSRSMALAMRIADDHDVVEYPAERLGELAPGPDVDAVVFDLGEPLAAMQALDRLRERGCTTPVLIVSGYQPAWNDLADLSIESVVVVALPITRAALLDGVDRLLSGSPAPGQAPHGPPTGPPARPPAPVAVPVAPAGTASLLEHAGEEHAGGEDAGPAEGRKRSGLSRFLTGGGSRPGSEQAGPSEAERLPVRNGAPLAPPIGPGAWPEPEQDLFRPAIEPAVPVRSPSPRPRTPISAAPSASTPAGTGAAQTPAAQTAGAPTAAPAPARPAAPSRTPVPSTAPSASASPSSSPSAASSLPPARPLAPRNTGEKPPARPFSLRGRAAPEPGSQPSEPASQPPAHAEPAEAPGSQRSAGAEPAAAPDAAGPFPPARPAPGPAPSQGRGPFGGRRGRGQDRGGERHPGFTRETGLRAAPPAEHRDELQAAVSALLDRRSELFGVTETAQVLADEVVERGESDAAAVLVPDGLRWRVSGGVGLRPLERRLLLDMSHWLICEIAVGGRALIVEDSDIVRPRLAGAPLAAWRHLLAVPVPGIRAAVVLARGQEAARFTERDLATVVPVVAEAGPLLSAALQLRELARALASLRDVDS